MIFVSQEQGSADLKPLLEKQGLPVADLVKLDYADVEFVGRGVGGENVIIGVEVKRLSELTGDYDRFAGHQLPKMNANYDYRWLIYEGEWTVAKRTGALLKRTGRRFFKAHHGQPNAHALRKKLLTLEMCGGFHKERTYNRRETVEFLIALYRFWTDEDLDEHKSHIVNYDPIGLVPLTRYQRAFAAWPELGTAKAKAVAKYFNNSLRRSMMAGVDEWADIEIPDKNGTKKRLGTALATRIFEFLQGR